MKKYKKWYPAIMAAALLGSVMGNAGITAQAAGLPFDMQQIAGVQTKEELDKKLEEIIRIPEAVPTSEKVEPRVVDVPESLPFDLSVILNVQTKNELDTTLEQTSQVPDFDSVFSEAAESQVQTEPEIESKTSIDKDTKDLPKIKLKTETDPADAQPCEKAANGIAVTKEYSNIIMVGDSRFVGMNQAANNSLCQWICDESTGYDWLVNTAISQIDEAITSKTAIVLNLGVNDVYRPQEYVSYVNDKVNAWVQAGADVYYMSVNPVNDGYGGSVTNASIEEFNSTLASTLSSSVHYIDTYQYLTLNGFDAPDGLHYDAATYTKIFDYCMEQLGVS